MTIQTQNSAHAFRIACLLELPNMPEGVARLIQEAVEYKRCPRCMNALPERPHGSIATRCRCIPICEDCAVEEAQPETYLEPGSWPIPLEQRLDRKALRRDVESILEAMDREEYEDGQHSRPAAYSKSDAALDALAMIQGLKLKAQDQDPDAIRCLWETLDPNARLIVASTLAGWVITMNGLTAIELDAWAEQIRNAALAMRERGE